MEYLFTMYRDETSAMPTPGTPEFEAYMAAWMGFNRTLMEGGHWIAGAGLAPTETATTLERRSGDETLRDGPFAETKEPLGGFYLIRAADLDEAVRLARLLPLAEGCIEVRPVTHRADREG
jgi:hypothetical protein